MSLTKTLEKKEMKVLFKSYLGNVKPLFLSDIGDAFPKTPTKMVVPPPEGISSYSLGNVGTAYDFWFRSYLQRKNKITPSPHEFNIVYQGLQLLKEDGVIKNEEYDELFTELLHITILRDQYCEGKEVSLEKLGEGLLIATYCQNYYRSRSHPRLRGYLDVDEFELLDLMNLCRHTSENAPSFSDIKNKEDAQFNPTFGDGSRLVGGADADLMFDNVLIDIKTTKEFGCQAQKYNQIIGYYFLDKYYHNGKSDIERIGLYFSRQHKYVFMNISDLSKHTNLEKMYEDFINLAVLIN